MEEGGEYPAMQMRSYDRRLGSLKLCVTQNRCIPATPPLGTAGGGGGGGGGEGEGGGGGGRGGGGAQEPAHTNGAACSVESVAGGGAAAMSQHCRGCIG